MTACKSEGGGSGKGSGKGSGDDGKGGAKQMGKKSGGSGGGSGESSSGGGGTGGSGGGGSPLDSVAGARDAARSEAMRGLERLRTASPGGSGPRYRRLLDELRARGVVNEKGEVNDEALSRLPDDTFLKVMALRDPSELPGADKGLFDKIKGYASRMASSKPADADTKDDLDDDKGDDKGKAMPTPKAEGHAGLVKAD